MKGLFIVDLKVKPVDIENTLEALQKAVDGYIETVPILPGEAVMIVNEEGRLREMPVNVVASIVSGKHIVGPALIVGVDGEEFTDIPEKVKRIVKIRYGGPI